MPLTPEEYRRWSAFETWLEEVAAGYEPVGEDDLPGLLEDARHALSLAVTLSANIRFGDEAEETLDEFDEALEEAVRLARTVHGRLDDPNAPDVP